MADAPEKAEQAESKPKKKNQKAGQDDFTQEVADRIFDLMANGETLTAICRLNGMPSCRTVQRWCHKYPEFAVGYQRARELLADALLYSVGGASVDGKGRQVTDWQNVQRSKLRVDARKWVAAKLAPHKYSDRVTHAGTPDAPIEVRADMTPKEVAAALAELIGKAEQEIGLTSGASQPIEERVERIKEVGGGVLPPALYRALYQLERGPDESVH